MAGSSIIKNISWKFAEQVSSQLAMLIVSIVLARILTPHDFGVIAIVNIFTAIANAFVINSFGTALIQKKDADALDFSSVLYFNIFFCIVIYVALYFCAPLVSDFYDNEYSELVPVLRVLCLSIILMGVLAVQNSYISRKMLFKKFFISTSSATFLSGLVGIMLALTGFGVWALVWQYILTNLLKVLVLANIIRKPPLLQFSFARLRGMLGFGSKTLVTSMLITCYLEFRATVIGKLYSAADLAFYDRAKQFPSLAVTNVNNSIESVLFPHMSRLQDDIAAVKATCKRSIRFSSYIMMPLLMGLLATAEPLVRLVLTDKWLPTVPLLQWFCLVFLFQPIHTANMQALKAIGKSGVQMKLEFIKKGIELACLLVVMWYGVEAIVVNMAVLTTLFTGLNAWPNRKYLNYTFGEQVRDIFPSLAMSSLMCGAIWLLTLFNMPAFLTLIMQVVSGPILYLGMSKVTHNEQLQYIIEKFRGRKTRHK